MKVLLSGGGTAGHTTPLLAVADKLRGLCASQALDIFYIGQKGDINADTISRDTSIKRYFIHAGKFRRYHSLPFREQIINNGQNLHNFLDVFRVIIGFFESVFLLIKIRPDVIFFKGGFVVVPIGFAARLLRIPYITHDSDALPGLANRLIAKGATYNAVAHQGVTYYPQDKTVVTGIPLVQEYLDRKGVGQEAYKQTLGIPTDSVHLFIYAGTQGARVIDDALESIITGLLERHKNLYISHVFGRLNEHAMDSRYADVPQILTSRIRKLAFIDNAYDYIAASDIIVARAGATSMAEFATIGRACIVVPAEQLTGGHQLKNAEILEATGAVLISRENGLQESLKQHIETLIADINLRTRLEHHIQDFAVEDASTSLAELILRTSSKGTPA